MDSLHTAVIDTLYVISKTTSPEYFEIFNFLKDILLIFIAVAGALIAYGGLKTWRKQLKGKTEYELAKKLLRSVYEVREAIRVVRNPFISGGETQKAFDDANISIDDSKKDFLVYQKRWTNISEALSKMSVESLEAEVIWGEDIKNLINSFRSVVNELRYELTIFLELGIKGIREEYDGQKVKEIRDIIYEISDDPLKDKFTYKVQESIRNIETFIMKYLNI